MTRLTAKDFPQQLLEYYDYYAHGKISKREFLQLAGKYTVGGMTALALFNLLKPDYALAEQVPFTDPDIRPEYIHYPSPDGHGEVRAYQVMPAKIADKAPAVVVVHENRGLNPYIEDVARRVAKAGYIALAPDGLSSVGGYPGNDDEGRATIGLRLTWPGNARWHGLNGIYVSELVRNSATARLKNRYII